MPNPSAVAGNLCGKTPPPNRRPWPQAIQVLRSPQPKGNHPATQLSAAGQTRHRGEAEDLTQQFFARFLEKEHYRLAQRDRGRCRSFLLTMPKHFLVNGW